MFIIVTSESASSHDSQEPLNVASTSHGHTRDRSQNQRQYSNTARTTDSLHYWPYLATIIITTCRAANKRAVYSAAAAGGKLHAFLYTAQSKEALVRLWAETRLRTEGSVYSFRDEEPRGLFS